MLNKKQINRDSNISSVSRLILDKRIIHIKKRVAILIHKKLNSNFKIKKIYQDKANRILAISIKND
jgi:hypothetical protein